MNRPGFELVFNDDFTARTLDEQRWIPAYLPHWSTWEQAAARYTIERGQLHLLIEDDQPPWCPAIDGDLRVSSLQTGLFAGDPGSTLGQHPFDPPAIVQNGPHDIRRYTPTYGRIETRLSASNDPRVMVALWMIGLGESPDRTGEICVCEIFGRDVTTDRAAIGVGVHPHQDASISDDFERIILPLDVTGFHDYAAEWTPERITFFIDGTPVKIVEQSINYPMQLMLGMYEFPPEPDAPPDTNPYPKRLTVDHVRGYRHVS